jgi:hypothetical protein
MELKIENRTAGDQAKVVSDIHKRLDIPKNYHLCNMYNHPAAKNKPPEEARPISEVERGAAVSDLKAAGVLELYEHDGDVVEAALSRLCKRFKKFT